MAKKIKIQIKVKEIMGRGKCSYGHKPGQKFNYPEDRNKICPMAYYVLTPAIMVLQYGGSFPWSADPDKITLCCSDEKNPVVYEVTRTKK